jgi:hypothetical protein
MKILQYIFSERYIHFSSFVPAKQAIRPTVAPLVYKSIQDPTIIDQSILSREVVAGCGALIVKG